MAPKDVFKIKLLNSTLKTLKPFPYGHEGRDLVWCMQLSHETPKLASNQQKLGEKHGIDSSSEPSKVKLSHKGQQKLITNRNSWAHFPCRFSHVQLFATPWTIAHQAPLSRGSPKQECWSGLPFPPSDPGFKPASPASPMSSALKEDSLILSHQGNPSYRTTNTETAY